MTDERIEAQDRAVRALFVAAAFWLGPVGPAQPVTYGPSVVEYEP